MKYAMKTLDPTKRYTLDGMPVKILGSHGAILTAAVQTENQDWHVINRQLDGTAFPWASMHSPNIIEVPETQTLDFWLSVYHHGPGHLHRSRGQADAESSSHRIACIHVTQDYKVGEGLQ